MTKLEKLQAELDEAAMAYGELWYDVKRGAHQPRLDILEKETAVLLAAQKLFLARRKIKKVPNA